MKSGKSSWRFSRAVSRLSTGFLPFSVDFFLLPSFNDHPARDCETTLEERENKDGRKAPCVVAFSSEKYGGCAMLGGILGECGRRTESKRPGKERDTLSQRTSSHPPDSADQIKKYDKRSWQNWRTSYREFCAQHNIVYANLVPRLKCIVWW